MALTKEKQGEIAMQLLQLSMEKSGELKLNPTEIKRGIHNMSKKMDIPIVETAEFVKIVLEKAYEKTMKEINMVIDSNSGKVED